MTSTAVNLTAAIAEFVAATPRVDAETRDAARKVIADSIACIVAGSASEVAGPIADYLRSSERNGTTPIIGTRHSADPEAAALAQGTFGHALDFDDGSVLTPVHPSVAVVSALLAGAGAISGDRFIDAYTIGVEVAIKLGVGIGIDHYERGFHGTSTLAVFGAVAALSHAGDSDPDMTQRALGIAASMASGVQCNFGTMVKPLHTGIAARNAVAAFNLSRSGFTAAPDAIEHPSGLFAAFGSARSDPARTLRSLGRPLAVRDPGMSLKRHACCYASHRPMHGILELRTVLGMDADTVEEVVCTLAPGSLRALIHPRPRNGLEAKFSLEYALAAGIADGKYSLWSFSDEAVRRPHVQALLPRMRVGEHARCAADDPNAAHVGPSRRGFVELQARTRDGRTASTRVVKLPGSPDQPLGWDDVEAKFRDCVRWAGLSERVADRAWPILFGLDQCSNVAVLVDMLNGKGGLN